MNCLLVSATAFEISPFLAKYRSANQAGINMDVSVTGIGLISTVYSLMKQISIKKPDIIIQAGIGGCFDKNIALGSVLAVKKDTIADLGVIEQRELKSLFDMGFIKPNRHPFSNGWLVNREKVLKSVRLKKVSAVSVNHITTSRSIIDEYRKKFDPVIESMEGAALHYVCLLEKIPFLQLRSVSNYVGERNKKKWLIKESIENLNNELSNLLAIL